VHESVGNGAVAGAGTVALRAARKAAVLVVGGTVLGLGVALIVLPGPAFLVIPAGLAILATEFVWARRLLRYGKERGSRLFARVRAR
jgi:tellurite resistance protein TerC